MMTPALKVLLIEDDEEDYILLRSILSACPRKMLLDWAGSFDAGLRAISSCVHDVVLVDYRLGQRNGLELLYLANNSGCDVPVIMLTGQGGYEIDVEAMKAGAADYLVKEQITPDLLDRSIRYSIERKHSETELKKYKDHLEELVKERTSQLEKTRDRLEEINQELLRENDYRVLAQQELAAAHRELEKKVAERTNELARANEALNLEQSRLEALWELSQMNAASTMQVYAFVLDQQVRLTGSRFGLLGFTNEDETALSVYTCTGRTAGGCTILNRPVSFPIGEDGIWSDTIRNRGPVIVNQFITLDEPATDLFPDAGSGLHRKMCVPVIDGDRVVAVALVADKKEDYDQADVRRLTLLMDGVWKLLQREEAQKALRESENLASLGRALSSVAHDLKTSLVAIGGFTRSVYKHIGRDIPYREKLEIVMKETGRMENLINEMLDFSKPLKLHLQNEDVNQLIDECILVVRSMASEKKIGIQTVYSADLPPVAIDPARIKQVVINLLSNAVHASPEGKAVIVYTRMGRSGFLLIDVKDCGCGIPPEKRGEIFMPFVSFREGGTGLGLPIVKKIVESHHGRIQIFDNPESGITFRVAIPPKGKVLPDSQPGKAA